MLIPVYIYKYSTLQIHPNSEIQKATNKDTPNQWFKHQKIPLYIHRVYLCTNIPGHFVPYRLSTIFFSEHPSFCNGNVEGDQKKGSCFLIACLVATLCFPATFRLLATRASPRVLSTNWCRKPPHFGCTPWCGSPRCGWCCSP